MANKGKLPTEEKVRIVELYLAGRISYTSSYKTTGIGEATLRRWINQYKMEGATGLHLRQQMQYYSNEIKHSAVIDYLDGKGSLRDICNKYGIRKDSILAGWLKVYDNHGRFRILTGGSCMTKGRKTILAERVDIARECISKNNNYGEIALKY